MANQTLLPEIHAFPVVGDDELQQLLPRCQTRLACFRMDQLPVAIPAPFWLRPEELEVYRSLGSGKRKIEWLAGRLAAKTAVARLLGRSLPGGLASIGVVPLASGKPVVQISPSPPFQVETSISHSGELAAAIASPFRCGLDVQQLNAVALKVRDRFSFPEEQILVAGLLPLLSELEQLCLLWAAKEALRKMAPGAPLAGFLELRLLEGESAGMGQVSLDFSFSRPPDAAVFRVAAFLRPGYAWAIAAMPGERAEAGPSC